MSAAPKQPTKLLFTTDRTKLLKYTSSINTDLAVTFAKWRKAHEAPTTNESYQRDVLAEHRARKARK